MSKRYSALRIIANIYRFFAGASFLFLVMAALFAGLGGTTTIDAQGNINSEPDLLGGLFLFAGAVICFVSFYGVAEFISLMMAIEENTRATAALLNRQRREESVEPSQSLLRKR